MDKPATNTYGGGIDQTAVIGHAPESREWHPGLPTYGVGLGEGVRVEAFATIDAGLKNMTTVGARTWVFKHSHVGHDAQIGEDCELSTGCIIGGHCEIGNGVRVGIGAVLRPFVKVGDGARIGCGAVVVKNVAAGDVVAGNPARPIAWLKSCPDAPCCGTCPCADEDDVCFPGERQKAEALFDRTEAGYSQRRQQRIA